MPRPRPVTDPDRTRRMLARRFDLPDDLAAAIPDGTLDAMVAAAARLAVERDAGRESRPADLLPHRPRAAGSTSYEVAPAAPADADGYDGGGRPIEEFLGGGRELAAEALRARRPTRLVARRTSGTTAPPPQPESDTERRLRLEYQLGNVLGFSSDREARITRLAAQAGNDPQPPGGTAA